MKCPICKKENNDDWPIEVNGLIYDGGCQDCWETHSDKKWWDAVTTIPCNEEEK